MKSRPYSPQLGKACAQKKDREQPPKKGNKINLKKEEDASNNGALRDIKQILTELKR